MVPASPRKFLLPLIPSLTLEVSRGPRISWNSIPFGTNSNFPGKFRPTRTTGNRKIFKFFTEFESFRLVFKRVLSSIVWQFSFPHSSLGNQPSRRFICTWENLVSHGTWKKWYQRFKLHRENSKKWIEENFARKSCPRTREELERSRDLRI